MMTFLLVLLFKYGVRIARVKTMCSRASQQGHILHDILCNLVLISNVDAVHQYHLRLHGICWLQHIFCAGGHHHAAATRKISDTP